MQNKRSVLARLGLAFTMVFFFGCGGLFADLDDYRDGGGSGAVECTNDEQPYAGGGTQEICRRTCDQDSDCNVIAEQCCSPADGCNVDRGVCLPMATSCSKDEDCPEDKRCATTVVTACQ